nr:hypothetical protein Q903MT_gene3535 [Picea sitchensis]
MRIGNESGKQHQIPLSIDNLTLQHHPSVDPPHLQLCNPSISSITHHRCTHILYVYGPLL